MKRRAVVSVCAFLVLTSCGSGSDGSTTESKNDPSKPPDVAASKAPKPEDKMSSDDVKYFTLKDTKSINKAAAPAQAAGATALKTPRITACDKINAYPPWRRCWHSLLDPYSKGLGRLAGVLTALHSEEFPEACQAQLRNAARTFDRYKARVEGLRAGFDSDTRAHQISSLKRYGPTLSAISREFAKPFQRLTQACYSPEDLASINASPTPDR